MEVSNPTAWKSLTEAMTKLRVKNPTLANQVENEAKQAFAEYNVVDEISGLKSFTTQIDGKIRIIGKEALYGNQAETFFNSEYATAELVEDIMTYRRFGGNAKLGGSYVSTVEKLSREELALVEEFNNSMRFEAIIKVPKGEKINIGKVGPWPPKATEYMGGADQIILKYGYPEHAWVHSIKDFKTGKIYTYGEFRKTFPNMCQ